MARSKHKGILLVIFILALIIGLILYLGSKDKTDMPQEENNITHEGGPEFDPISLPALMGKEYNGRDLKLGDVLDDNQHYIRYHITYKSGELMISGIMNIPKGAPPEGGFPVLILNHGHIDTSVYTNGRGLRREQDYLARQGFAVIHPDYRNHAQSDKDPNVDADVRVGYIEDVINAVHAVKKSNIPDLNKDKIGMLGHSMGGGIAQAVMVVAPELVDAYVLYAPVSSDVVDSYDRWLSRSSTTLTKILASHGSPEEDPEFWENISPRTFFDRVQAPVIIFHGTSDESCDIEWSRETRDLLLAANKEVELVEYPGQPHEFGGTFDDFMRRSAEFFENNLK